MENALEKIADTPEHALELIKDRTMAKITELKQAGAAAEVGSSPTP